MENVKRAMNNNIYIFGAHSRAKTLWIYLNYIYSDMNLLGYLVDDDEVNVNEINGVPVIFLPPQLENFESNSIVYANSNEYGVLSELELDASVYLGIRGCGHESARKHLERIGFKDIIPVTPEKDIELRNAFLKKYYAVRGKKFFKMEETKEENDVAVDDVDCSIYVIRSAFDKPLESEYVSFDEEVELQVGAALTEIRLSPLGEKTTKKILDDSTGDNISNFNSQFCELTGIYWVWKNTLKRGTIVGFEHYRRHFLLGEDWKKQFLEQKIDVILPTPLYVWPSVEENYRERHVGDILDYVYEWMNIFNRDNKAGFYYDVDGIKSFMEQPLYVPCNMYITRSEIFDNLCQWLFPVLFAVVKRFGVLEDRYQNRYPGFLAERMTAYFFMRDDSDYNIRYVDKSFLF